MKKTLLLILFIFSVNLHPQQLPKYAPGQAIVTFNQSTFNQIGNELLQEYLQTSNSDVNQLFTSLGATRIHNILKKDNFDSVEEDAGFNREKINMKQKETIIKVLEDHLL